MRPPDDNQTASTRPPSCRPRAVHPGEDNILARLERDGRRGRTGIVEAVVDRLVRAGQPGDRRPDRRAGLARPGEPRGARAAHRGRGKVDAAPDPYAAPDSTALLIKGGFAPLPAATAPRALATTVIDVPPERVMVKADEAAAAAAGDAEARSRRRQPPNAGRQRRAAAPPQRRTRRGAPSHRPPPPVKLAVAKPASAPRRSARRRRRRPPRPRRRAAAVAKAPPRPKKIRAAQATAAEPAPLDSDVALLSAIIMHADRHAGERAATRWPRAAPARSARAAQKATD